MQHSLHGMWEVTRGGEGSDHSELNAFKLLKYIQALMNCDGKGHASLFLKLGLHIRY